MLPFLFYGRKKMGKARIMKIVRLNKSNEESTVGELYLDDAFFCYTMEQPWNDNKPFKSCIPTGIYNLEKFKSKKYGNTFALYNEALGVTVEEKGFLDLTNRYAILLHPANWAYQLEGCIAPGRKLIKDAGGKFMVTSSADTVKDLLSRIDVNTMVEIVNEGDWG
jgi:hypothetical protein